MLRIIIAWLILAAPAAALQGPAGEDPISAADALLRSGKFAEARKQYEAALTQQPRAVHVIGRLGYIALLENRLDDAERYLRMALKLNPKHRAGHALLAETYYRRDDFAHAARHFKDAGQDAVAETLESFRGVTPYQIEGKNDREAIKFVVTDPLPLVRLKVNNSAEINCLIDTGASELVLDPDYAKEVGAKVFGSTTGTFAGGKQAAVRHARVDSVTLGGFTVRNVPVHLLPTRPLSGPVFGGKRVDGILGTVFLKHFLFTLDYPRGELILARNTPENRERLDRDAGAGVVVPFWMAGDHFMVAWTRVNQAPPVLMFVDTGLAGGGLTCGPALLKEAGIKLNDAAAGEGIGGGGKVRVVPFVADEVALGGAVEHKVRGLDTGAFPLEYRFGFRMAGIISHGFFRTYTLTFDFPRMRLILGKAGIRPTRIGG